MTENWKKTKDWQQQKPYDDKKTKDLEMTKDPFASSTRLWNIPTDLN